MKHHNKLVLLAKHDIVTDSGVNLYGIGGHVLQYLKGWDIHCHVHQ
jgi:hypothetical protein